ncbi:hypothetical protein CES86_0586 [Brucella lupini]|uniref:Uncharacterized protein n=1 Tax=Brucella lupini TaxID=255457 RepID=A0A256GXV1_9HYPH|nr:hypothetical protein CES86_0586 [Brucella lupini]
MRISLGAPSNRAAAILPYPANKSRRELSFSTTSPCRSLRHRRKGKAAKIAA